MLALLMVNLVAGAALGLRARALVLAPASVAALLEGVVAGLVLNLSPLQGVLLAFGLLTAVHLGYLFGAMIAEPPGEPEAAPEVREPLPKA
jgi:hypothetical protein